MEHRGRPRQRLSIEKKAVFPAIEVDVRAGEKMGQLGISDPSIWDPERGYAGLVLAMLAAVLLWWWVKPSVISSSTNPVGAADFRA